MNKITLLLDGTRASESLLDCVGQSFGADDTTLVGIVPQSSSPMDILRTIAQTKAEHGKYAWYDQLRRIYAHNQDNDPVFIERFLDKCQQLQLRTRILYNDDADSNNLLRETVFSDLLVLSARMFVPDSKLAAPPRQQLQLLRGAGCPILVVPEKYEPIENYLLVYEGSTACMRTIKQFSAQLSEQARKSRITLAIVGDVRKGEEEADKLFLEYAHIHFPKLGILRLEEKAEEEIIYNAREDDGALLVVGNDTFTLANLLVHNAKIRRFEFPVFIGR
jgi:hypothetical protein